MSSLFFKIAITFLMMVITAKGAIAPPPEFSTLLPENYKEIKVREVDSQIFVNEANVVENGVNERKSDVLLMSFVILMIASMCAVMTIYVLRGIRE